MTPKLGNRMVAVTQLQLLDQLQQCSEVHDEHRLPAQTAAASLLSYSADAYVCGAVGASHAYHTNATENGPTSSQSYQIPAF